MKIGSGSGHRKPNCCPGSESRKETVERSEAMGAGRETSREKRVLTGSMSNTTISKEASCSKILGHRGKWNGLWMDMCHLPGLSASGFLFIE